GHHLYLAATVDDSVVALDRLRGSTCGEGGFGHLRDAVELSVGGIATYTVTARVNPAATGSLVNSASVRATAEVLDPDLANNTAVDTDLLTVLADLAIVKSDGLDTVAAGAPTSYTVTVTNQGPGDVRSAMVSDLFPLYPGDPAGLETGSLTWSCATSATLAALGLQRDGEGGVDGLDGAGAVAVSPDLDGPGGEPGGEHLYVTGAVDHAVVAFHRDPTTGALTFLEAVVDGAGEAVTLGGASALALSPDGHHLYSVERMTLPGVSVLRRDHSIRAILKSPLLPLLKGNLLRRIRHALMRIWLPILLLW
ncbi:MAG: hypothetical protein R6V49_01575, partial [Bacteroidales bacterium]